MTRKIIIKTFTTPKSNYIYDRETNSILPVTLDEFEVCKKIEDGTASIDDLEYLKHYINIGYLKETQLKEIEHPSSSMMPSYLKNHINHITLQVTQDCNLRCSYCAYGGDYTQRTHDDKSMSLDIMKQSIDFVMRHSRKSKELIVSFYGGEPMLAIDSIKECVSYISNNYLGKQIKYAITTNGTLFELDAITFLEENEFDIHISLDGPEKLHNVNRRFSNGEGSFDKIISNISRIKNDFPGFYKKIGFMTTVAPNVDLSCINDFYAADLILKENNTMVNTINAYGSKEEVVYDDMYFISYTYEVMKVLLSNIGIYTGDTSKLYDRYMSDLEKTWKNLSKSILTEKAHPGGPCLPGITRLFIAVDGTIYPCERVSETTQGMKIGDIYTGFDMEKVLNILNIGKITEDACKVCWNFFECRLCVAACDKDGSFSKEERLKNCESAKQIALNKYLNICMLLENGYNFETQKLSERGA